MTLEEMNVTKRCLACQFRGAAAVTMLIAVAGCMETRPMTMPMPAAEVVNPYPRPFLHQSLAVEWSFDKGIEGWTALNSSRIEQADGALRIVATGNDPYVRSPDVDVEGPVRVTLKMKSTGRGGGQIFWVAAGEPGTSEDRSSRFTMIHDGLWHEYSAFLPVKGNLRQIRLDPGDVVGTIDVGHVSVYHAPGHPLEIEQIVSTNTAALAVVRNHGDKAVTFSVGGKTYAVPARDKVEARLEWPPGPRPFEAAAITAKCAGLPDLSRPLVAFNPAARARWVTLRDGDLTLEVAPDGTGARLVRKGAVAAVIAPLVWRDGQVPPLAVDKKDEVIRLTGPGVPHLELRLKGDEITYRLEATEEVEGPVVRVQGNLEQGLLAGVEHLGKGERSSSTLDIHGPEHVRNEPDPMKLTMPLAVFVSDRASGAMLWTDTELRPTFATPNFYDGAADHRMSLKGRRIEAVIRIGPGFAEGGRLEDAVVWAVKRRGGFPALPPAARTPAAQTQLHLDAFTKSGTVAGKSGGKLGWYHAGGIPAQPQYYADHASTIWRLTDKAPEMPTVVPGGAHVPNDAIWFVTGRAADWLRQVNAAAEAILKEQQPDGSFRYDGRFREGHFENTASGLCAVSAARLLEHARLTGSRQSLQAGIKALEYMKRFRTPRGVQVWECPLHSPDILASAYLVWAYTRSYELTGKREYLDLAVRWAASGVPFVYQWSNRPIMLYATTPVLCATHWQAPVWVGLPVQWCGTVYAYALLMLAPHDATLDWKQLAEGILIAGEQMQYPDGKSLGWGCLPDSFELKSQERRPPDINPCALVSLRLLIEGKLDSLAVAAEGGRRVVAPFPVTIRGKQAVIAARKGVEYQVVVDASRVVTVKSEGEDTIPLE